MTALPNPFISESATVSIAAQNTAEGDPAVMPDYAGAGTDTDDHRFVLDVEAFYLEIEPRPLFLQRGRA